MRFGFYISIIEMPIEIILGKLNAPAMFVSGGLAAVALEPKGTPGALLFRFMGSGFFIGAIGLFMNRGQD